MPLTKPAARTKIHHRKIDSLGFLREDGLWDIETRLIDTKEGAVETFQRGRIQAGEALHDISLRLTIDSDLLIKDIEASTDLAPMNACSDVNPWYKKLIGERIKSGWRLKVKSIFAGEQGCTHLNEMLTVAATTAFQTIYPWLQEQQIQQLGKDKVFHKVAEMMLDSCHGFSHQGELIMTKWPELSEQGKIKPEKND